MPESVTVTCALNDDGTVDMRDGTGASLPENLQRKAKRQKGAEIRAWLAEQCEEINQTRESLRRIHENTPAPGATTIHIEGEQFGEAPPPKPNYPALRGIRRLFPWARRQAEAHYQALLEHHKDAHERWEERKAKHEQYRLLRREMAKRLAQGETDAIETLFSEKLGTLEWPRETLIDFEVADNGRTLKLDVDLPEIEDIPQREANLPAKGYRLSFKKLKKGQLHEDYARHVHGVLLRVTGEVFANIPTVDCIIVSGYTQRVDLATGRQNDDYIISAKIDREAWKGVSFDALELVDPIVAFERFDLRRDMKKGHELKAIEPLKTGGD
jgi:hypothetical protein